MKNRMVISLVVILISLSCNFLVPGGQSHIPDVENIGQSSASLPVLDPGSLLPSPGAAQLNTLLADQPGIASLVGDVQAAEQAAMQAMVVELQASQSLAGATRDPAILTAAPLGASTFMLPSSASWSTTGGTLLAGYRQPGTLQSADGGLSGATIIGLLSSMFTDTFTLPEAMSTKSFSQTETKGNATTDMSMEIGRSQDGSTRFGLGLKSEGTENGASVKSEMSATIDGQRCPTAEGQVSFSIKARLSTVSGGAGTTQDLTTFVRATVGDDGEIASSTFDVIQGTQQSRGGRQVYLETGDTIKFGQGFNGAKESNWRVNQKTDNATQEDVNNLEPAGFKAALELGIASLMSARNAWQGGKCVKIVAASPGTVKPGSTTDIPVKVISVFDGADAPSKLEAALSGEKSVEPTLLAKTPGTLKYIAPDENGKTATIKLTATSRRGKATLELIANTGGAAYQIVGGLDDFQTNTAVCDITKPFTLTGGGFALKFSGGLSGSYNYSGGPFNASGGGTYTISLPDGLGKPGSMTGGGNGCIESPLGTFCNDGTEQYTLTPLDPAAACTQ